MPAELSAPFPYDRRAPVLAAAAVALCLVLGLGLAYTPNLTVGLALGTAILALTVMAPLVAIGAMLAVGLVDWSPLTGGFKAMISAEGGLDLNGVRLIALVVGLGLVVAMDERARAELVGPRCRLYLLFLLYAGASIAVSVSVVDGLRQWFKMAYLLLLFVTVVVLPRSPRTLERLADVMLAGGALLAWVVNPLMVLLGNYVLDGGRLRITVLAAHQNPESFYFLVIILLAVSRYAVRRQPRYLVLTAACFVWIFLAMVRIALAATVFSAFAVGLTGAIAARNRRVVLGTLLTSGVLVALLLPGALIRSFGYIPSPGELFALVRHPDLVFISKHIGMEGREFYWPVVFGLFLQHPLLGTGLGTSRGVLLQLFPASWSGAVHNEYLRLLSETGLLGFGLFAAAVLGWTRDAARAARRADPLVREFALAAVGAAVVWGVTALTDNALDWYNQYAQHVVFLLAATTAAVRLSIQHARATAPPAASGPTAGSGATEAVRE